MKKDFELLEAARTGNVAIIDKLISPTKSNAWTLASFGYEHYFIDLVLSLIVFYERHDFGYVE